MLHSLTKLIWQTKLPYHQMGKMTCFANIFLSFLPAALLLSLPYWTASFALFLILLPPPLVPEPATLHFSHLSTFFVLVVFQPATFQPKYLLPTSPSWPQITFSCRLVQQWRRASLSAQCPQCRSSLQRLEGAQEKSRSSPGNSGEECALLVCGDGKSRKHWWAQSFGDKGCGLSSAKKKKGQKFSTPMFNTTLLAMSWLWLVLPVWIAFHGDRRKHRYKIKSLLEAWRTSPETAMKIFFKKKKSIILPSLILQILVQLLKMREIKEAKEEQDLEKVNRGWTI